MAAYNSNVVVYAVALFTSGLTAFYMFRLYFSIFWSKEAHLHETHHGEGSLSMKIPLIILSVLALFAGLFPVANFVTSDGIPLETHIHVLFSIAPVLLAVGGILLALSFYQKANNKPEKVASAFGGFYRSALNKFYVDEIYLFITKKVLFNLIGQPATWVDKHIVDGMMNKLASGTALVSEEIKEVQSGKVQSYALYFFVGILILSALFIYIL